MKICIRTLLLVGQTKAAAEPLSLASLASSPNGGYLGISTNTINMYRKIWKTLNERRMNRK